MSDHPTTTVAEIARLLGAEFEGDGTVVIRSVATLEQAGADSISWVGTEELLPRASKSKAAVLLVPQACSAPEHTVIRVSDPDESICAVLEMLAPPVPRVEPGVHLTAVVASDAAIDGAAIGAGVFVGAGAKIGAGTQLHPGCYVGAHTQIGRECVVWPNVVVRERVEIGDRVIIHPNATIGADGFGYLQQDGQHRKIPQIGTVIIENDVEIGAGTTIDRARSGTTRVGRGTKIDNLCQIAHNCDIGEYCIIMAQTGLAGSVTLGHHVVAAGRAGVSDHKTMGNGVQIAAASVAMSDFPEGTIVRGIPAIEIRRFRRVQAAVHKLPEYLERIRALAKRVEQLEAQLSQTDRESDP